jgi:hypothetical protein
VNPLLIKTKNQQTAVSPNLFVKFGNSDANIVQAAGATASIIGVANSLASATVDDLVDICLSGIAEVKCGGSITRGNYVTSDANGKAVAANLVAGTTVYHGGIALENASDGDIIPILVFPGVLHNDSLISVVDVTISTAELLALNATAKEIIPAPGANKAVIILGAEAFMDYNSAAYDGVAGGEDLVLAYTNVSGTALAKFETTGFLDQASDQRRYASPSQYGDTNLTPTVNAAVVAALLSGEIATGNSPVKIRAWYRIIDTIL